MKATRDHSRVSPEGKAMGAVMAKVADKICPELEAEGEPDVRCKSCAFRAGTVPNGCLQTQMDAYKAVAEDVPFGCHVVKGAICHGWFAARILVDRSIQAGRPPLPPAPFEFSPPDGPQEL